jgi:hypothetical protein
LTDTKFADVTERSSHQETIDRLKGRLAIVQNLIVYHDVEANKAVKRAGEYRTEALDLDAAIKALENVK